MSEANKAVFLSYASQDAAAARRICDALRAAGIEVWFDQSELVGGDAWDQKIRGQIKACALFVPVISAESQARREGYFRLEWKLAAQRTQTIADGTPFLLPVVIDATRDAEALVPEEFRSVQWTRLAGGEATPAFIGRVKNLIGLGVAPVSDRRSEVTPQSNAGQRPALPRKRSPLALAATVFAIVVAIGTALFVSKRSEPPATPPKSVAETKTAPVTPAVNDKSIAVLPFENRSEEKANAYFTDGIHEDILTNLAQIRELRVVSRTSVMEYRSTTKKMPQIARELGVAFLLEGSVQRSGNSVHITGQLIRAATDEHVWAQKYDEELTAANLFAIQSKLAQAIAGELQAALSPQEKVRLGRAPTNDIATYELYLRSRDPARRTGDARDFPWRVPLLEQVVKQDPGFALAWVDLAALYGLVYNGNDRTEARRAQMKTAIESAMRLDPASPDVMIAQGRYYYDADRDWARARAQFERVIRLLPRNSRAIEQLAYVDRREGRWVEAVGHFQQAHALDPRDTSPLKSLGTTLLVGRRFAEAEDVHRQLLVLQPELIGNHFEVALDAWLARGSTVEMGELLARPSLTEADRQIVQTRWSLARGDAAEFLRWSPETVTSLPRGWALIAQNRRPEALTMLEQHRRALLARTLTERTNDRVWSELGMTEAALGHKDAALAAARKAVELRPESVDAFDATDASAALACVQAWCGEKDEALRELARLLRIPTQPRVLWAINNVRQLRNGLAWQPLRGDPRFEALLNDPKNNQPLF